jgi:hypothetical protein
VSCENTYTVKIDKDGTVSPVRIHIDGAEELMGRTGMSPYDTGVNAGLNGSPALTLDQPGAGADGGGDADAALQLADTSPLAEPEAGVSAGVSELHFLTLTDAAPKTPDPRLLHIFHSFDSNDDDFMDLEEAQTLQITTEPSLPLSSEDFDITCKIVDADPQYGLGVAQFGKTYAEPMKSLFGTDLGKDYDRLVEIQRKSGAKVPDLAAIALKAAEATAAQKAADAAVAQKPTAEVVES